MESNLIVEWFNYINQAYHSCVLLMEARWNMWNPCTYLMPKYKPGKMECKFCGNVISYHKDKTFFHLGFWYDNNGWARDAMCSKTHPRVKALFGWCGRLILPPLKDMDDAPPSSLMDSTMNPKVKTLEGEGVGARSIACSTSGVEGRAEALRWDYEDWQNNSITRTDLHKPNNKLVSA